MKRYRAQDGCGTGSAKPFSQALHRVSVQFKEALDDMINGLLARNIITPSISPWAASSVLAKKNKILRLSVVYRKLIKIEKRGSSFIATSKRYLRYTRWFESGSQHQI